jgi:hypothetical protein
MDPHLYRQLRRQVKARVDRRLPHIAHVSGRSTPSTSASLEDAP